MANQSGVLLMAEGECLLLAQLGLGQYFSGLLTGGGVDVEVLEKDLGAIGGRSATLGVVLGLDVDGRGHRGVRAQGENPVFRITKKVCAFE